MAAHPLAGGLSLSRAISPSRSLVLSLVLSPVHSRSFTRALSRSLTHSRSLALSDPQYLTHTRSVSGCLWPPTPTHLSVSVSLSLCLSVSLSPSTIPLSLFQHFAPALTHPVSVASLSLLSFVSLLAAGVTLGEVGGGSVYKRVGTT